MKIKKVLFMIICLSVLLVPNIVLAAETFTYGDYEYSIEKVNVKTDLLTGNEWFLEMDEQSNYIFEDYDANKYYKVNEKECLEMSNEEVLKLKNTASPKIIYVSGYDIFEGQQLYYTESWYIKTSDTQIDSNKQYWQVASVGTNGEFKSFITVQNPDISEIDTYYEEIYLRYPTSTEIDSNVTYYTKDEITNAFIKVDNPISEEINKYRIEIEDNRDSVVVTKIATLDKDIFEEIFNNYYIWDAYIDEATNKIQVVLTNGYDTVIYTSDGTFVKEFKDVEAIEISIYSNSFFAIKEEQGKFKIMDKDSNIVFENETLPLLNEIKYENNVNYLAAYDDDGRAEFYKMTRTKRINDDNNDNDTEIEDSDINNENNNIPSTDENQNLGEKDDTPKTGSDLLVENNIVIALMLVISIFAILKLKKNR